MGKITNHLFRVLGAIIKGVCNRKEVNDGKPEDG